MTMEVTVPDPVQAKHRVRGGGRGMGRWRWRMRRGPGLRDLQEVEGAEQLDRFAWTLGEIMLSLTGSLV